MLENNRNKLLDYAKEKAKGLERIRQNAQHAYQLAQLEKKNGNFENALRWMNRAYRLTRNNPNIIFDLVVLYLKTKKINDAYHLLQPLMKNYDFYEGWIAQAVIFSSQKKNEQLFYSLNYLLAHYSPTQNIWHLAINLLKQNGHLLGCCCFVGSLNEIWIESFMGYPVNIYLDNQLFIQTNQKRIVLSPDFLNNFNELKIEKDNQPLIGSPISLKTINKSVGFVEVKNENVIGWLWFPSEPERIANLTIRDQKNNIFHQILVKDPLEAVNLEVPLFQAKAFSIKKSDFPSGFFSFQDEYLCNLIGSPLSPHIEQEGMDCLVDIQNKSLQAKSIKINNFPKFLPIKADYRGGKPKIGFKSSLGIVIVIPIFKGKEETLETLKTVMKTINKTIIVQLVNDCSPDVELIEALNEFVDDKQVFCIHHHKNKGYPGAVNSGIKAWPDYDIILLNSDTLVTKGWIESLNQAAYSEKTIGTVTPFSNNASIFSYPFHDKENKISSLKTILKLSKICQYVNAHQTTEIPTAHGFCMFIRHDCLKQAGLFREDLFAQGYGEENEFCIRARHLGWKHVLATDCLVGHKGSISFKRSSKLLGERNTKILNRLYPGYDEMIQDFIQENSLFSIRRKIDMERLRILIDEAKRKNVEYHFSLIITHQFGGGVERAVQERVNNLRLKNIIPILLRPTLFGDGCKIEIQFKSLESLNQDIEYNFPNLTFYFPNEENIFIEFLNTFSIHFYEIHHLKKHHESLFDLLIKLHKPYDIYIHDYLIFCPRTVLLNEAKQYCGDPCDLQVCQSCVNSMINFDDHDNLIVMEDWIKKSCYQLQNARTIYVPSKDSLQRISRHFPGLKQLQLKELEDDRPDLSLTKLSYFSKKTRSFNYCKNAFQQSENHFRICIIGAIGIEKGFNNILSLLQDADKRNLPLEFILIGRSVDDELLMRSSRIFVTGEYKEEEALSLVIKQNAHLAFFPSICPETWCYSLSIAWRAGLKTVSYDIGAIAERIVRTKRGEVIPLNLPITKQNDFLLNKCKHNLS